MNKKVVIISVIAVLLLGLLIFLIFTRLGQEITQYLLYKITTPKETVTIEEKEKIKITYTYRWQEEKIDIEVDDKEFIEMIRNCISNKKLINYSGQIGLAFFGQYSVDLGDDVKFIFDSANDGYVIMYNKEKSFLTQINSDILKKVIEIVDEKLTEKAGIFETDHITISKKDSVEEVVEIKERTIIEYIFDKCKNIYIKEVIDYQPQLEVPDYQIDFNNNVKLLIYKENQKGWLLRDGILYEAYGLTEFDIILKNIFEL